MVFHLVEAGEAKFRLKMLPMTPLRRKGDRVIVTLDLDNDQVLIVEVPSPTPDPAAARTYEKAIMLDGAT